MVMKEVKRLLWWVMAGSSGGFNRARIIRLMKKQPCNANQIARKLKMDYKTARHHIEVLLRNNLINFEGTGYGRMYFISYLLEDNMTIFEEIWEEISKKDKKKKGIG